jgi:DNA-directed RNA polymerase sigma subunit (sigma70/sigma32)
MPTVAKTERNAELARRHLAGVAMKDLAEDFGITYERVRQLLTRAALREGRTWAPRRIDQ